MQNVVTWFAFLSQLVPLVIIWGYVLLRAWKHRIKPRLIPRRTIEREADEIIATFPDPLREATARWERNYYGNETWKAVYWSRVRKAVMRRLENR